MASVCSAAPYWIHLDENAVITPYYVVLLIVRDMGYDRAVMRPHYIQLLLAWSIHGTSCWPRPNTQLTLLNKGSDKII